MTDRSVRRWLNDIPVADPIQRQQATPFQLMLIVSLVLELAVIGIEIIVFKALVVAPQTLIPSIIILVCFAASLALLRGGYFQSSVVPISAAIFLAVARGVLTNGLVNSTPALLGFVLPFTLAGLLVGRRALLLSFGLSLAVIAFTGITEPATAIQITPQLHAQAILANSILFVTVMGLFAFFLDRFSSTLHRVFHTTVRREQEIAQLYREVSQERQRLAVTLASIGDAVIATDEQGKITFMNPIAEGLTGWQQVEAAGKPLVEVFNIVNEMSHQRVESPVEKVLREGSIVGLANHTVLIAKDGREVPIDDSGAPIRTHDGAVAGVILVFRDVTERRAIEQEREQFLLQEQAARAAVQAANEKLQFLTQVSTALVSSIDYEQTLRTLAKLLVPQMADNCAIDMITADSTFARVAVAAVDPAREEVLRELALRYPPDPKGFNTRQAAQDRTPRLVPELTDAYLEAAAQSAEHFQLLKALDAKSLLTVPLVVGERGLGAITLGMADSNRTYNQEYLDLMIEVAQRAAFAIDHARLYREAQTEIRQRELAEHALQAAVHSRDEFLSIAAHELKTPVTSVRGFAQTLLRQLDKRDSLDTAQVARSLYVIDKQATKLGTLVSQLLDISRLEGGKLTLEPRSVDLSVLVNEVITNIQRGKDYPIVFESPDNVTAWVDPLRLEQVIVNLLDNAMKFSQSGEPIEVQLSKLESQQVQLSIADHGIGIPLEHRDHLFERFYQAHNANYQSGMGLGLYISREILQLHQGEIRAEFPDEGGTRFVITVPSELLM